MNYKNTNCTEKLPLLYSTSEDKDLQTSPCPDSKKKIYYQPFRLQQCTSKSSTPVIFFFIIIFLERDHLKGVSDSKNFKIRLLVLLLSKGATTAIIDVNSDRAVREWDEPKAEHTNFRKRNFIKHKMQRQERQLCCSQECLFQHQSGTNDRLNQLVFKKTD